MAKFGDAPAAEFVSQGFEVLEHPEDVVGMIARAARTCYRSEARDEGSDEKLVRNLLRLGHEAMVEFATPIQVRITCDRGISHEIVRHRLFSFAQESQRYVNSSRHGFEFIIPDGIDESQRYAVGEVCRMAARSYDALVGDGVRPELARSVLPNCTATRICVSGNAREWRHFLRLRCDPNAHPSMRALACDMLDEFRRLMPVVFDDVAWAVTGFDGGGKDE